MGKFVKNISEYVAFIGLGGLIILSIVILVDIIGRELLGMPIPGFSDITGEFIIITAAACFPASFADRSHVSVRFVGQIVHWRVREALDLLGNVATLVILLIIVVQLVEYSEQVWVNKETTWLIALPIWPVWWTVTALLAISSIIQALMTYFQVKRLFSPVKLSDLDAIESDSATVQSYEE
ncbi:TRAP transporter small permease [Desulforhopalus singaporensis]|uniref:TRAP-type C4-dicarboxylate transport system, small permease component n=1 Tax=Desulforhopalus singaporensis TaxID=91360 RepID=A0A1H0VLF9_9BACT|nr:TRAP transporter small permease subunit [Desulforhopalus singaporensis]SDP79280.1 TRAP-type C4-dicarboxylate transport system, small permease component [Desulforhopalus singaporensis]